MFFLEVAVDVSEKVAAVAAEAATALAYNAHDLMKLEDESVLGRLIFGLKVAGFGMGVVFVVLILLWGILELFGKITAALTKETKSEDAQTAEEVSEPAVEEVAVDSAEDEGALIAVLTAAVIEYNKANEIFSSDGEENKGFRIVSFKERNKII